DVAGVLDTDKNLLSELSKKQTQILIADGTIHGGMIPKVDTCLHALENGVGGAVIIDGRVEHALLLELFTEHGVGTLIRE
ncbi:MAG: acetylglutamate kinase, partial [Emcibacter sp.]|nr:acetylglutamate kinase [Emcibacter sp.]